MKLVESGRLLLRWLEFQFQSRLLAIKLKFSESYGICGLMMPVFFFDPYGLDDAFYRFHIITCSQSLRERLIKRTVVQIHFIRYL